MRISGLLAALALLAAGAPARADGVLEGLEKEIRSLVEVAGPAVVKVTVEAPAAHAPLPAGLPKDGMGPFLARMNRVGTGFLVSADGIVLTTDAIAEGAETARVDFPGGVSRRGEVLGTDAFFHVAVLKIEPVPGVQPLSLSEAAPAVCDLGVFLGNASGLSRSISLGVVTGVGRSAVPLYPFDNYLVVDVPTPPGDAGGPFLNREGRVLGMAAGPRGRSIGFTASGGRGGVAFLGPPGSSSPSLFVPASDLRFALGEIRAHGRVRRGLLGVVMRGNSLEIRNVRPDSPAEKAGLLSGDVITGIAGKPVDDAAAFAFRLRRSPVDEPLSVTVRRGEKAITVTPVLRELVPGQEPLFAGIAVSTVKSTVVVAHVSSRLAAAGLRAGDRVLELNGEEIHDGDALLDRIADLKPKTEIRLKIRRGDDELTLTMTD